MRNVCEAWNDICTDICRANASLLVKMAPKLREFGAKTEQLSRYYGQNNAWTCIVFPAKLFQSPNHLISKVYSTWEGNSTCLCYPMTPVSVHRTPRFCRNGTNFGLIVPK